MTAIRRNTEQDGRHVLSLTESGLHAPAIIFPIGVAAQTKDGKTLLEFEQCDCNRRVFYQICRNLVACGFMKAGDRPIEPTNVFVLSAPVVVTAGLLRGYTDVYIDQLVEWRRFYPLLLAFGKAGLITDHYLRDCLRKRRIFVNRMRTAAPRRTFPDAFEDRLRRYYREHTSIAPVPFMATGAAELAAGVVAVQDSDGETSIYFDEVRWGYAYPDLWEKGRGYTPSPILGRLGLEVLEGVGLTMPGDMTTACAYAKRHLHSNGLLWHSEPRPFEMGSVIVN